jgi:hypothetical protein
MPDAPPVVPAHGEGVQVFREIVSAIVALAILTSSTWMLVDTFRSGRLPFESAKTDKVLHDDEVKAQSEAYGRQKDLLLYALALLGTVTGYYLGRVPAEQRAQQAQQTANTAQTQLSSANNAVIKAAGDAVEATKEGESAKRQRDAAKATLTNIQTRVLAIAPPAAKVLSASPLSAEQKTLADIQRDIDDFLSRG